VDIGYRFWKVRQKDREPRLASLNQGVLWEPEGEFKENISDYSSGLGESFEETGHGFYSKKALKELLDEYGEQKKSSVAGAILPYGLTAKGTGGYRSERARVSTLFKDTIPCYVCQKRPSVFFFGGSGADFGLCDVCRRKLTRLIDKLGDRATEYTLLELLDKLADIYGAEVQPPPPELEIA
jgi:hypothetical protein